MDSPTALDSLIMRSCEVTSAWLPNLRMQRMDVVGDFAGPALFLVDGNYLIQYVFEQVLKMESGHLVSRNSSSSPQTINSGYYPLVCRYVLEKFLSKLITSGASNFIVVLFKDRQDLPYHAVLHDYGQDPLMVESCQFASTLLMNYLRHSDRITTKEFSDFEDKEWSLFLNVFRPFFILTSDGLKNPIVAMAQALFLNRCIGGNPETSAFSLSVAFVIDRMFSNGSMITFVAKATPDISRLAIKNREIHLVIQSELDLIMKKYKYLLFNFDSLQLHGDKINDRVVVACINAFVGVSETDQQLIPYMILHAAILPSIPLKSRAFDSKSVLLDTDARSFLAKFYRAASYILSNLASTVNDIDLSDLVDPRLFGVLVSSSEICLKLRNVPAVAEKFEELCIACDIGEDAHNFSFPKQNVEAENISSFMTEIGLFSYDNPVISPMMPNLPTANPPFLHETYPLKEITHEEKTHWHSQSQLSKIIRNSSSAKPCNSRFKEKNKQKQASHICLYAASLTGANGRILERRTVVVGEAGSVSIHQRDENKWSGKGGKQRENKSLSKKEQIIAENKARQDAVKSEAGRVRFLEIVADCGIEIPFHRRDVDGMDEIGIIRLLDAKEKQISEFERRSSDFISKYGSSEIISLELDAMRVRLLFERWHISTFLKKELVFAAALFENVVKLIKMLLKCDAAVTVKSFMANMCRQILLVLGLDNILSKELDILTSMTPKADKKSSKKGSLDSSYSLPFKVKYPKPSPKLSVGSSYVEFQLEHCGDSMERMIDSQSDKRVDFEPDGWQREILDHIDAKESILVVAPTSAGKTFCSYYAMEQVLRSDNEGIVIYVAPTKALVNQVAAEIEGRFSKTYKYPGTTVWSILTRDYRIHNPLSCQILVTVPAMLQILLLNPDTAGSWIPRIKRVIFDEIHCIGEVDGGIVWEQLLLMIPSPILALSATIGNLEEFGNWMKLIQSSHNHILRIVHHRYRYSDLRKYLYIPGQEEDGFYHINPFAALRYGIEDIENDIELEPRDMLKVAKTMIKVAKPTWPLPVTPDEFFATSPTLIRRHDTLQYLEHLKSVLIKWMNHNDAKDRDSPLSQFLAQLGGSVSEDTVLEFDLKNNDKFPDFVSEMDKKGFLPSLFFSFDRHNCDVLLQSILSSLTKKEAVFKSTNPSFLKKMADWQHWKSLAPRRLLAKMRNEKVNPDERVAEPAPSEWESFDPDSPLDQFSYSNRKSGLTFNEIEEELSLLQDDVPQFALDGLRRGISVHHAGMNRKYLQIVERWFRKGWLRVVICTGTLALGINMPAKSSVFVGDSIFLTTINYRQASGRAGRRGFDTRGNVIFFNISLPKIHSLITSRLPHLNVSFPLSSTLVLRMHLLLSNKASHDVAVTMIKDLLSLNRLSLKSGYDGNMSHFLRASIEYLRQSGMLNESGSLVDFSGLACHLFYTEPSNFAFCNLLKTKALYEVCRMFNSKPTYVCEQLIIIISTIFNRLSIPSNSKVYVGELVKQSPSLVFLPPLPETILTCLEKESKVAVQVYSRYAVTYASSIEMNDDAMLSFSQILVNPKEHDASISSILEKVNIPYKARSAFVALLGKGDVFESWDELANTLRPDLSLDVTSIPSFDDFVDETIVLNSFILDFYKHGQVQPLIDANMIRRGDVWLKLNEFWLILLSIRTSLEVLLFVMEKECKEKSDVDMSDEEGVSFKKLSGRIVVTVDPAVKVSQQVKNSELYVVYRVVMEVQKQFGQKFAKVFA